ncbi:hypothetical protein AB3329_02100 [Streptococcus sp. H31]|uniref:hypothetical protein n=1 Tax=Streptococcus huangxiaojuni TaxID=3237239 RepID=UPI0034A55D41
MKNRFCHFPHKPLFLDYYVSSIKPGKISYRNRSGPAGGNAIDKRADLSMLKAFAESLDRRSAIFWYNQREQIDSYDIVTGSICKIEKALFALNDHPLSYRDTTGTAAHTNGEAAVRNSLQELFQKNALALMWYAQRCYKETFKGIDLLINDDFFPVYHTLILLELDGRSCFGMGSSVDCKTACQQAFEEALLLLYENSHAEFLSQSSPRLTYQMTGEKQKKHFKCLIKGAAERLSDLTDKKELQYEIEELVPNWVSHVYITLLPNAYNPSFKVVKSYSPDLFPSLPYKSLVLAAEEKSILQLINKNELAGVPDIPSL